MDSIPAVGAMVQPAAPVNAIATLQGMLGVRQQQQGLQLQQEEIGVMGAEQQQAQQKNQELQKAQSVLMSVNNGAYRKPDGSLDRQSLANDLTAIGPYATSQGTELLSQANEMVQNKQAYQNLSEAQQKQLSRATQTLAQKPNLSNSDVIDTFTELSEQNPQSTRMLMSMLTHLPNKATPQQLKQLMAQWSAAAGGQPLAQARTVDVGGAVQPGTSSPYFGGFQPVGAPLQKTLPPQVVPSPVSGGPAAVGGAYGTGATPLGTSGGSAGQSNASPNYPRGSSMQPYPGEQKDIQRYQEEVQQVRDQAQQAPLAHNINQEILRLSQNANTGPGSETWQHAIGALGAPFGLSPTANYQEVAKFLEKNALSNMQAMGGPPSDARLQAAAAANGGPSFSPKALRYVTQFNDATTTALEAYRQGLDKAVGTIGPNYLANPEYKKQWAQNFDVRIFEYENARQSGDRELANRVLSEIPANERSQLKTKWQNLQTLSATGYLPQ